jgi:hypothetical protein
MFTDNHRLGAILDATILRTRIVRLSLTATAPEIRPTPPAIDEIVLFPAWAGTGRYEIEPNGLAEMHSVHYY